MTAPDTERCTHTPECDADYEKYLGADLLDMGPRPPCDCQDAEEEEEPELSTAQELGAGSYLGYGNNLP